MIYTLLLLCTGLGVVLVGTICASIVDSRRWKLGNDRRAVRLARKAK